MEKIKNYYDKYSKEVSDINEHLPTLKKYAEECNHITEMGVRSGLSTVALLMGSPKKMISYDITDVAFKIKNDLIKECNNKNIDYIFEIGDTLKIDIEKTDLLFIDTLHTYNQLLYELNKHSKNVNNYIILHDTTTFGYKDEIIYNHASDIIKNNKTNKSGLFNAILDFLKDNKNWEILEKYENNNGLTILKKMMKK